MPSRTGPKTAQRRAAARDAILGATRDFVGEHGFRDVQMSLVAMRAGISVGAIYKHFPSRADLLAEVYVVAVTHEFDLVREAVAAATGTTDQIAAAATGTTDQIAAAVRTFCQRAIQAGRFGHALLTEPTDPAVDEHRLAFRENYRALFAQLLAAGIERGELPPQDIDVASAAVLGIMTETLVRPLADPALRTDPDALVPRIVHHCLAAVGAEGQAPLVRSRAKKR